MPTWAQDNGYHMPRRRTVCVKQFPRIEKSDIERSAILPKKNYTSGLFFS